MKHLMSFSKYAIYTILIIIPLSWFLTTKYNFFYSPNIFFGQNYISFMWDISWLSLLFVMSIRPLSELFPKTKLLKKLIFLRKFFGILSATIVVTNLAASGLTQDNFISNYFSYAKWDIGYPLIARISEITAILLLVTSNLYSVKKLGKNWKKLQKITYLYFISGGLVAAQFEPSWYYGTMIVIGILCLVNLINKKRKD